MSIFLDGRTQFPIEEVLEDRIKCMLRYQSEAHFSHVTDTTALKDRVTRSFFHHLHHIHNWAHACANFYQPFYLPARDTYFEEVKLSREEIQQKKQQKGYKLRMKEGQ